MDEGQMDTGKLVSTTDCLEAVGVFRFWKNLLFAISLLSLLFLQTAFWAVRANLIETENQSNVQQNLYGPPTYEKIETVVKAVIVDPNMNTTAKAGEATTNKVEPVRLEFGHIAPLIRFSDFLLVASSVLYCLTMLFILKISMLSRLGGINHVTRALFLSLVFTVLVLPWQQFFPGVAAGLTYTPQELLNSHKAMADCTSYGKAIYYIRFCLYWLVALAFLTFAQIRSCRWAKAILRRLEVI